MSYLIDNSKLQKSKSFEQANNEVFMPILKNDSGNKSLKKTNNELLFNEQLTYPNFEKVHSEGELIKILKKALYEAIEQNTILRDKVIELEAFLAAAGDEIENKNRTILELANYIEQIEKQKQTMDMEQSVEVELMLENSELP